MNYPEWSNCMRDLLEEWEYNEKTYGSSLTWIEDLIKHDNV